MTEVQRYFNKHALTAKMYDLPEKPDSPRPPAADLAFVQDTHFTACDEASKVQRISIAWNEAAHKGQLFDRQHVAIAYREAAKKLYELANEIEGSV